MRIFTHLRGQMWLLPFLALSCMNAQTEIGISGGAPQLLFYNYNGIKGEGLGFLLGGSLRYPLLGNLGIRSDALLSYESTELRLEGIGSIHFNRVFLELPVMVSYLAGQSSLITLEYGVGLQPHLLLSSTAKISPIGEPVVTISETNVNRLGLSIVLLGGFRIQRVGLYTRFDPMLTYIYPGSRSRQSGLTLVLTYWLSR